MMLDSAVNALIAKKAAIHNKFLRKAGQARDQVSMDIVDEMKRALRRLVKEKATILSRAEEAEEANEALKKQVREGKVREAKMRKLIQLLHHERDYGPAAAVASLKAPPRDTIAEDDPLDLSSRAAHLSVPRRERIAERRVAGDEDEDEEDDEEEGEDEDEGGDEGDGEDEGEEERRPPARRPAARPTQRPAARQPPAGTRQSAVDASFFKTASPASPAAASARQPPPMMANILSHVSDGASDGVSDANNELDDILGIGN